MTDLGIRPLEGNIRDAEDVRSSREANGPDILLAHDETGGVMTDLVCAACSRPVTEGRCPTCRASRLQQSPGSWLTPELLVLLIAAAAVLSLVVSHLAR
jgi:hypothetical protein